MDLLALVEEDNFPALPDFSATMMVELAEATSVVIIGALVAPVVVVVVVGLVASHSHTVPINNVNTSH